jgi:hypothetical protein
MLEWYMEPKQFNGTLAIEEHCLKVTFTVAIALSGEADIVFEPIPADTQTTFLHNHWAQRNDFTLTGSTSDGTIFLSEDILFTTLGSQIKDTGMALCLKADYSTAKITLKAKQSAIPYLKLHLKNFKNLKNLIDETVLGKVVMGGVYELEIPNNISGFIKITAPRELSYLAKWQLDAEELADHIRYVMSFAAGTMLTSPITEFGHNELLELNLYSQTEPRSEGMRQFKRNNQSAIFKCAVKSHIEPQLKVKNLRFAIDWFAMNSPYREANLISTMTVLENLIDSNLNEPETLLLQRKKFDMLRKNLRATVKKEAATWGISENEQNQYVIDLNERFADLNRRSLMAKINLLAKHWGVNLDDISQKTIESCKRARDYVVHRGAYEPKAGEINDLSDHLITARELVVRFILTALQYDGKYFSYVGGYHKRDFLKNTPGLLAHPTANAHAKEISTSKE